MTGRFVLDVGVALSWILPDDSPRHRAYAAKVLRRMERQQPQLVAPSVFFVELAAVLFRAQSARVITKEELEQGLAMLEPLQIESYKQPYGPAELVTLGRHYNITPHDALYVAIAEELSIPLAAFEPSVRAACSRFGIDVFAA